MSTINPIMRIFGID